ncbi:MAG: Flavin-dependent thymidylate synthase [Calditrichaeota bacterium]|nr:Flavin-dependent thymidylate synthase [Calditrichota bacterium]
MSARLPLRVVLAGYNVDRGTLAELVNACSANESAPAPDSITPETISAAYARISRNPANVGEIREKARTEVEKARRSNENIVFGLGHASVAEHAAFNIDVTGISRLAVETVERHRLASFTEKSQRYIKLDGDAVIPPEIVGLGLADELLALIDEQNAAYETIHDALADHFHPLFRERGVKRPKTQARGRAGEDARYVVSLATEAQFGMTLNARTLEIMIRDALAHPLAEVRDFGRQLHEQVLALAPSLVKYVTATDYERAQFRRSAYWPQGDAGVRGAAFDGPEVRLVDWDERGEERVLSALVFNRTGRSWSECRDRVRRMEPRARRLLVLNTLRAARQWDPPPREFELAQFTFEVVISAAAYGQLKRHRMASIILGPYDPELGWTTPESVREAGMTGPFDTVLARSAGLAERIAREGRKRDEPWRFEAAAPYALCNGHRRRVVFHATARELYHVSRLREDEHAQWDIRALAGQMIASAREVSPALFVMAVGKHEFARHREKVYGADDLREDCE